MILRLGVIPDAEVDDYFAAADVLSFPYGSLTEVLARAAAS